MVMEWSHSQEALDNVYANLKDMNHESLTKIYAEWIAYIGNDDIDIPLFNKTLIEAGYLSRDQIVDIIWQKISAQHTCTNDGGFAHGCPFGCIPHLIPFDRYPKLEVQKRAVNEL